MNGGAAPRVGVFVCHCGHNIAGRVRIEELVAVAAALPGVVHATDYTYMCSEPGQGLLRQAIVEQDLQAVVVACCSPRLHETTFRRAADAAGLNPHCLEIANIREQCSWIHSDPDQATAKALRIVSAMVAKGRGNEPLEALSFPVTPAALVIGAGIAGMQTALEIAEGGHQVWLVERQASIGGNMARLSETFPTLDCAQCTLTPKMVEVAQHPMIELLTCSEVESIEGYVGCFQVRLALRARYVDWDLCTGCGACVEKCPARKNPSEFERGMGTRPAIYTPFPQAVPNKPTIDRDGCLWFGKRTKSGKRRCGVCQKICPTQAVRFDDQPRALELEVGAVVVATGYRTYALDRLPEYGGGQLPDVIDALQLERLLSASGPTAGELLRPSDGRPVESVAFVHCAGSRDVNHKPYCSKVCCMALAKHALLFKQRVPHGQAWSFYIDLRHAGRDYEEFLVRAQQAGVRFVRGKVVEVAPGSPEEPEEEDRLIVRAEDTLSGNLLRLPVDLVVLATAMEPERGSAALAQKLKLALTPDGFLGEAHIKLRPVESPTAGYFLAGAAQGPRDIPETVSQAAAAASKVLNMLRRPTISADPTVAVVHQERCVGCGHCIEPCPAGARALDEALGGRGRGRVEVNGALCLCCGACAPACPTGAADMRNFRDDQLLGMIDSLLAQSQEVAP